MAISYVIGGIAKCTAENDKGSDTQQAFVMVGDLDRPFMIWQENPDILISDGDNFTIHCGAIAYNYTNKFVWYFENENGAINVIDETNRDYVINQNETEFSYRSSLTVKSAIKDDIGQYSCKVQTDLGGNEMLSLPITVHTPRSPYVLATNLTGENVGFKLGNYVDIICNISGIPRPVITWYKDGERLLSRNSLNISIESMIIRVPGTPDHEGQYQCEAKNKAGAISLSGKLVATSKKIISLYIPSLNFVFYFFQIIVLKIYTPTSLEP